MFYHGRKMREELGFTLFSEIVFSDCCKDLWHPEEIIRFNKHVMLFCRGRLGSIEDDWLEYPEIEFCPWDCISGIDVNDNRGKTLKIISKKEIDDWRMNLEDILLSFPFTYSRKDCHAIMIEGKPLSERAQSRKFFKQHIERLKPQIQKFLPKPTDGPVEIFIDVFSTEYSKGLRGGNQHLPDADRLIHPITDSLEGIIYNNDRQVRKVTPRIWDISDAFKTLECRTEPMGLYTFDNIPIGCLYPLSKRHMNYYSIRINTFRE